MLEERRVERVHSRLHVISVSFGHVEGPVAVPHDRVVAVNDVDDVDALM
jgi:hypothetical protein